MRCWEFLAQLASWVLHLHKKRARDANRKSDLVQYRNAFESYANKNGGLYPVVGAATTAETLCGVSFLNLGITCPVDPKNGTSPYGYMYVSNAGGTKYILYEYLEASSNYFALCSIGSSLSQAAAPTLGNCP